jgi:hypothetical protein
MFWDVHTYYNENNFEGNKEDVFSTDYLSMNVLVVPAEERRELVEELRRMDMVEIDVAGGRFLLEE